MTEAVDTKSNTNTSYSILLEGQEISSSYLIKEIYIHKEVNKIALSRIFIHEKGLIGNSFKISNSNDFSIGKKVEIKLGYSGENKSVFKGIITSHGLRLTKKSSIISIECRDEAIRLNTGRKSALFEKKKDSDIIAEILKSYRLQKDIEPTKVIHSEMVQHYCTDWDFIMMRAETSGLLITTNNGKICAKKPILSDVARWEVTYGVNMIGFTADIDARNQCKSITSLSWDVANQSVLKTTSNSKKEVEVGNYKTAKLSEVLGYEDYLLQTSTNMPIDALEAWASAKHLKSTLSKLKGKVEFCGNANIEPATLLKLSGLSDQFNGSAFVSGVEHTFESGEWKTTARLGMNFEWFTEENSRVDPPSAAGLVAPFKGLAIGIVKQLNEDKDGQYRIKVIFPTLQKDNIAVWARLSNFYATKDAGIFFYPEINDEVVVGFLNEDPQHPIIMGMLYSSKNKPPFAPEKDNTIKAIVTKSKLTISFNDKDKIIEIITPDKNRISINDKEGEILISDKNKNNILLSKDGVSIETDKNFSVKAKGEIIMEASADIKIKTKGNFKSEAMNVLLEGKAKISAKGAMAELNGSGQTTIKGGMVLIN